MCKRGTSTPVTHQAVHTSQTESLVVVLDFLCVTVNDDGCCMQCIARPDAAVRGD